MNKLESNVQPMDKIKTLDVIAEQTEEDKCRALFLRKVNIMGSKYPDVYELKHPMMKCYYCMSYVPYGNAYFCQNKKVMEKEVE